MGRARRSRRGLGPPAPAMWPAYTGPALHRRWTGPARIATCRGRGHAAGRPDTRSAHMFDRREDLVRLLAVAETGKIHAAADRLAMAVRGRETADRNARTRLACGGLPVEDIRIRIDDRFRLRRSGARKTGTIGDPSRRPADRERRGAVAIECKPEDDDRTGFGAGRQAECGSGLHAKPSRDTETGAMTPFMSTRRATAPAPGICCPKSGTAMLRSNSRTETRSRSPLVMPGLAPLSRSALRTHRRSVSVVQPNFAAIEHIAFHCEPCSP